uniref:PB1 domain-containing protein n=1 Tax=Panagrellus redivivus TaxID=6233 RepID=A0A7E4VVS1_PANRE
MDDSLVPSDAVHIKWHHNGSHWHRFSFPADGLDYTCFVDFLKSVEPDFNGQIYYVDDEGDQIRISSTASIDELIRIAFSMQLKVVYLHSGDESTA